jgi:hypothetical protein
MRTQVFLATTGLGLASVMAAVEDGAFSDAAQRVLIMANNAVIPETSYGVDDIAGIDTLLERFDAVHSYNAVVAPHHPSLWNPPAADLPVWERALRSLWALEGDLHLVVESIHLKPALALCRTFLDATIDVYADGLMSYGPTPTKLPAQVGMRVGRLLHPDLVPGVRPLLLREYGVRPVVISTECFQKVVAAIGAQAGPTELRASRSSTTVLLGQHLSALQLITEEEEQRLHLQMVDGAVAAGFTELLFKSHPATPAGLTGSLVRRAGELGARLTVREAPELVETWYGSRQVDLVVGCSSTALATAALFGVPAARIGTELLLERLDPYEASNRVAAAVIAATVPPLESVATSAHSRPSRARTLTTEQVVNTVGYLMQPTRNPDLRGAAVSLLEQHFDDLRPYIRPSRLTELGLPGGHSPSQPAGHSRGLLARLGPAGPALKQILGPRLSRRLGNAVRRLNRIRRGGKREQPGVVGDRQL